MAILINSASKIIVQGITGKSGLFHALQCRDYGSNIVGGITPGKGGTTIEGFPVFDTLREAVRATRATVSMILVPAPWAAEAILEAADGGIELAVCITEGIPIRDMVVVKRYLQGQLNETHWPKLSRCDYAG